VSLDVEDLFKAQRKIVIVSVKHEEKTLAVQILRRVGRRCTPALRAQLSSRMRRLCRLVIQASLTRTKTLGILWTTNMVSDHAINDILSINLYVVSAQKQNFGLMLYAATQFKVWP